MRVKKPYETLQLNVYLLSLVDIVRTSTNNNDLEWDWKQDWN